MDVGKELRRTPKGQLKYDRNWIEEGRIKEFLDSISEFTTKVPINISPQILSVIKINVQEEKDESSTECVSVDSSPKKSLDACDTIDSYFYELQSEMELPILEYEEDRLKYIQDRFKNKKYEYEAYSKDLLQQTTQEYLIMKRKNELDAKRRAGDLQKIEEAMLKEAKEKELLQREHYQTQSKKLSEKVLEAEMKQKKAEEELRKKKQEQEEFRMQLDNYHKEAQNFISKALEKLNSCEHPSHLRIPIIDRIQHLKDMLQVISEFIEERKGIELLVDDVLKANSLVKKIYESLQDIANDVELAKSKALHEHEVQLTKSRKETVIPQKGSDVQDKIEPSSASDAAINKRGDGPKVANEVDKKSLKDANNEAKKLISGFIAADAVEEYYAIMENLKKVVSIIQPFVNDTRNKKYRFELHKAVNLPINAVSSNSGSHVRDKINRLLAILNGTAPEIQGHKMTVDSVIFNFCANLMAKQFVEQGDRQISAQYSTAFPIAMAVVGIWVKKPYVGQLILGHFYTNCPYLVPFYPPREKGQSDIEYYKSLGYLIDREGVIEEKYKFLNRMSGFMRLYAAIIQSPVPQNSNSLSPHPHGISWGWKWLSRVLNMEPRPDVTATLLFDFLEVTGHALQKLYGKQFKKILHILCKDYFQKIKRVTPCGSGGPVERLETFLQQTVKKGYISRPEGVLDNSFWNR